MRGWVGLVLGGLGVVWVVCAGGGCVSCVVGVVCVMYVLSVCVCPVCCADCVRVLWVGFCSNFNIFFNKMPHRSF